MFLLFAGVRRHTQATPLKALITSNLMAIQGQDVHRGNLRKQTASVAIGATVGE